MGITMIVAGRLGKPERPSFLSRRAHLLTTGLHARRWYCCFASVVRSARRIALSSERARQYRRACGRWSSLPVRLADRSSSGLQLHRKLLSSVGTTCHPPATKLPQRKARPSGAAALSQLWTMLPRTVHFLLSR